ncbi:hypothetical protein STANM309S_05925 [Streptomyces tanashiensis]
MATRTSSRRSSTSSSRSSTSTLSTSSSISSTSSPQASRSNVRDKGIPGCGYRHARGISDSIVRTVAAETGQAAMAIRAAPRPRSRTAGRTPGPLRDARAPYPAARQPPRPAAEPAGSRSSTGRRRKETPQPRAGAGAGGGEPPLLHRQAPTTTPTTATTTRRSESMAAAPADGDRERRSKAKKEETAKDKNGVACLVVALVLVGGVERHRLLRLPVLAGRVRRRRPTTRAAAAASVQGVRDGGPRSAGRTTRIEQPPQERGRRRQ